MNDKKDAGHLGGCSPHPPGIYRIVAKGKWKVPGGRLAASTPIALAFGIDSAQCCYCQGGCFPAEFYPPSKRELSYRALWALATIGKKHHKLGMV